MFGNRAKISAEELAYMKEQLDNERGFFENVNAKSKLIEADFDELEKSRQLEESSLKQLNDNANNVVEFSKDSMDAISALNDSFTECVKAAADNLTSLEGAAKAIATQHEDTCALVENNKHFTAPAKSLSETSDRLEEHVDSCADIAAQMKEQNKQMSVLSLNAAIEAGMLGEQGKLFVEAAESIREASVSYDSAIDAVKQELQIMCVLYTADVGGILMVVYDEDGNLELKVEHDENDFEFDEIGSVLKIKELQNTKRELFESLELYYRVKYLGEDIDLDDIEDSEE